jgi:hypothetical protein
VSRFLWRAAAVAAILAAVVALLVGPYRAQLVATAAGSRAPSRAAPCLPGKGVAIMDSPHISVAKAASVRYNSDPPTSGPHFPFVAAVGIYTAPLPDGLTVHALEHGHIVIHYPPATAPATVRLLRDVQRRFPADTLLVPRPGLRSITLTAWGRIDRLPHYDEARIVRFVTALRGRYDHHWTRPDGC